MSGNAEEAPQNENTPFHPRSPYGISKVAGFELTRELQGSGWPICPFRDSIQPRIALKGIGVCDQENLVSCRNDKIGIRMGNSARQSGCDDGLRHARDYIKAMWLMLQQDEPVDYVIGSGKSYSVREFLKMAFSFVGWDYRAYVVIDDELYRPAEINVLQGDASKDRKLLNWSPTVSFEELVKEMVEIDLKLYSKDLNYLKALPDLRVS